MIKEKLLDKMSSEICLRWELSVNGNFRMLIEVFIIIIIIGLEQI